MVLGALTSVSNDDLTGLTRFLTNSLDNTNAYTGAQILAAINNEYRELQAWILAQLEYDWKENTLEGTGAASINLTAGTQAYNFPTDMLAIDQVEIDYTGGTNTRVLATPIKLQSLNRAVSNITNNNAIRGSTDAPLYWVRDGQFFIDPVAPSAVTSGLRLYCTILVTDLAAATAPVFATPYHQILAYGAAFVWLTMKGHSRATVMYQRREQLKQEMAHFYAKRDADTRVGLRPLARSFR